MVIKSKSKFWILISWRYSWCIINNTPLSGKLEPVFTASISEEL